MNRVLTVARLQAVRPLVILGMPWLIALSSFALNWAIWGLADIRRQNESAFTGGVLSLYITVALVFVQAVTRLLPFAMGLSLSRRTYWLGIALFAAASSLGYGLALAVLSLIENGTDGWWVGVHFWAPPPLQTDNFLLQIAMCGAAMLAFSFIGIGIGVVYKRWGASGVWALTLATLLGLGGLAVLVSSQRWWGSIGTWFADQPAAALAIGLPAAVAVLAAALSFAGIRRVVP